jgi:hypothetical protein
MPAVLTILVTLMLLPWFGALAQAQGEAGWRGVASVVAFAVVVAIGVAAMAPSRSEARPQPVNLSYFLNVTDGEARLLAGSAARALPSELSEGFAPEFVLPGDLVESWTAPAEPEQIPSPSLANVTVSMVSDERVVSGQLAMNGAYRASIRIPVGALPVRVRLHGVETEVADTGGEAVDFVTVACQGQACESAPVEIVLAGHGATDADWYMVGQTPGLRVRAADAIRARRPATTTPIQNGDTAISLSRFRPGG